MYIWNWPGIQPLYRNQEMEKNLLLFPIAWTAIVLHTVTEAVLIIFDKLYQGTHLATGNLSAQDC